ncbi:MAG: RNA polymerase Rpb4 family protein [Candidatus Syntrophoarchaeum sp.]|nr:RNA polymerase Rpb4 family protein [Candidatus Syntrophoarchaeum sp.]
MIVKEIINEAILTLAEAKEILNARRRSGEGKKKGGEEEEEEMRYERRKATEHTTKFAKLGAKKSRELIKELLELEKMKEEIATRIATLMPASKNEVRAIYAKERYTHTEASIEKILDCVAKYE